MSKQAQRRRKGRPKAGEGGLDRGHVFAEALAMLEAEGLAALTMRRLADRLGVSAMALYNHVADKDDLLRGVAEAMVDQAGFAGDEPDWRDRIAACFRELRRVCRAHPEAVRLLETLESPPLKVFRPLEITLGALAEIGIEGEDALCAFYLLTNFTLGQASYEARGPFEGLDPRGRAATGDLARAEIPAGADWDFDRAYDFGLRTILVGLAANAAARAPPDTLSG